MKRRGDGLIEVYCVLGLMGVLVVLVFSALGAAREASNLVQCQNNLNTIYEAEVLWAAGRETSRFATGPGWNTYLLPYLENRPEVFRCPASAGALEFPGIGYSVATGTMGDAGGSGGSGGTGDWPYPLPPAIPACDISFNVFRNGSFTNLQWCVSIDSPWCRASANYDAGDPAMPPSSTFRYEIEDRGFLVENTGNWSYADDYADIDIAICYAYNGAPTRIKIIQHKNGSQGRRYDMLINGTTVVHDLDAHQGMVIDLAPAGSSGLPPNIVTYANVLSDYGLSVGSYSVPNVDVSCVDPKLFLILDFPKRLADFNTSGSDYEEWDKYFISDPAAWQAAYGATAYGTCAQYQALRHSHMANILFCDGHIELLPGDALIEDRAAYKYLGKDNPLWAYGRTASASYPVLLADETPTQESKILVRGGAAGDATPTTPVAGPQTVEPYVIAAPEPRKPDPPAKGPPDPVAHLHWTAAGDADVYLNGKPLRPYEPDFRNRPAEASVFFTADVRVREGDVITVGARQGDLRGFLLVAVDEQGRVLWATDATHWTAYDPPDKAHWWKPELAAKAAAVPVSVSDPSWPGRQTLIAHQKGVPQSIWPTGARQTCLYSVVRLPAAAAPQKPVAPSQKAAANTPDRETKR
jgi:prepilin-type processing-associated H-X9-DG protein